MLPYFLEAFKVLLSINFTGETTRALSLFVTHALYDNRAVYAKRTLQPRASVLRLRKGTPPSLTPGSTPRSVSPRQDSSQSVSLGELGVSILRMLTELICDENNNFDFRFSKSVTAKVSVCHSGLHRQF